MIIPMFIHQVAAMRKGCSGFVPHVNNQYLDFENIEDGCAPAKIAGKTAGPVCPEHSEIKL